MSGLKRKQSGGSPFLENRRSVFWVIHWLIRDRLSAKLKPKNFESASPSPSP
ncbi:hypothetical protein [Paenibacillus pseudetheri]|uniref:hypothetical protein n=1 Tax=Paenibacillus pseudetheri TaxID=2897682 RepID=UPI001F3538A8|nr:hypothetical protein [Paenibacillus pseudetheri]